MRNFSTSTWSSWDEVFGSAWNWEFEDGNSRDKNSCFGTVKFMFCNIIFVSFTGGMFSKTEMSEVLTEICKMDPNFDKEQFIRDCQFDIIPNVLEVSQTSSVTCAHGSEQPYRWQKLLAFSSTPIDMFSCRIICKVYALYISLSHYHVVLYTPYSN